VIVQGPTLTPIAASIAGVPLEDGRLARLTWGYFDAATMSRYTLTRLSLTPERWSLRAAVVSVDAFKARQKPLMFVAPHKRGEWRWPVRRCDIERGEIQAELGPAVP